MTQPERKPLSKGEEAYQELVRTGLESMLSAADEINRSTASRMRRVPEPFFQGNLLPIIRDWIRGNETEGVGYWLNVADGLNNPIAVVDPSNNETLFVCPPPFVPTPLRTTAPEGERFTTPYHIVQRQQEMIRNGDVRGVMEIEQELANIYQPRAVQHDLTVSLIQLIDIYRHYDLPMEELLGSAADEIMAKYEKNAKEHRNSTTTPSTGVDNDAGDEELIY